MASCQITLDCFVDTGASAGAIPEADLQKSPIFRFSTTFRSVPNCGSQLHKCHGPSCSPEDVTIDLFRRALEDHQNLRSSSHKQSDVYDPLEVGSSSINANTSSSPLHGSYNFFERLCIGLRFVYLAFIHSNVSLTH